MARKKQQGIKYYPCDTDIFSDRKIRRLIAAFGAEGYMLYNYAICEIYRDKGYYVVCDEDFIFDVGYVLRLDESKVRAIFDLCIKVNLFDVEVFERENVLTSAGIQSRYKEIKQRSSAPIDMRYEIDVAETGINATLIPDAGNRPESTKTEIGVDDHEPTARINVAETGINATLIPENEQKSPLSGINVAKMPDAGNRPESTGIEIRFDDHEPTASGINVALIPKNVQEFPLSGINVAKTGINATLKNPPAPPINKNKINPGGGGYYNNISYSDNIAILPCVCAEADGEPSAEPPPPPPNFENFYSEKTDAAQNKEPSEQVEIDFEKFVDWFNKTSGGAFGIVGYPVTSARKKMIQNCIAARGKASAGRVVANALDSPFLRGKNKMGWTATFDWIFQTENYEKILSGNYAEGRKILEYEEVLKKIQTEGKSFKNFQHLKIGTKTYWTEK